MNWLAECSAVAVREALRAVAHSEVGIPLADHRTPAAWVDDLDARFSALALPG